MAADVQTIATALIAGSTASNGVERIQHYRAVRDVAIAAKHTLTRNNCLRANIKVRMCVTDPRRILERLVASWRVRSDSTSFARPDSSHCFM